MKHQIFFTSLVVFLIVGILPLQACSTTDPESIYYKQREDNRQEGILRRTPISGSFDMVSLATRSISSLDDNLTIKIPKITNDHSTEELQVTVREIYKRYLLDHLQFNDNSQSFYDFTWSTCVLKDANVSIDKLRAIATLGSQQVYIPVIVGQPSNQYEFVFYSPGNIRFTSVIIKRNGQEIYTTSRPKNQRGEIIFTWYGLRETEGQYEFSYVAELEQTGRPPLRIQRDIIFEHNPNWFK